MRAWNWEVPLVMKRDGLSSSCWRGMLSLIVLGATGTKFGQIQ